MAVTRLPDVNDQLRRQGIEPMTSTPEEFAAFRAAVYDFGSGQPAPERLRQAC